MRFFLALLPAIGCASALAQAYRCEDGCPQVNCRTDDAFALCQCVNGRERRCKLRCPRYEPQWMACPPIPTLLSEPTPTPVVNATPSESPCVCDDVCIQVWPQSCHCANDAKMRCWKKCGGPEPTMESCPAIQPVPEPLPVPTPVPLPLPLPIPAPEPSPEDDCHVGIECADAWPEWCYCENAKNKIRHELCGAERVEPMICREMDPSSLKTITLVLPTARPYPANKRCGGFTIEPLICPSGYVCISDPNVPEGIADATGICAKEKMCGGFAGFPCNTPGQICVDDSRDDCDPRHGGADCAGLCVWPLDPF